METVKMGLVEQTKGVSDVRRCDVQDGYVEGARVEEGSDYRKIWTDTLSAYD